MTAASAVAVRAPAPRPWRGARVASAAFAALLLVAGLVGRETAATIVRGCWASSWDRRSWFSLSSISEALEQFT